MAWPSPQDYNEAIQNPRLNFSDPELQSGQPEVTALGLPKTISGAFASVYRLNCGGKSFAVRCFTSEVADQQQRYEAISRHLAQVPLPYTVGFEYLAQGIRIQGRWYPILKMEWVQGESLDEYLRRNLGDSREISALSEKWMQLVQSLSAASIAHGDLQHGNILVANNNLKIIDYDGMFVPALKGRTSHEMGHRNYQSPHRTPQHFDLYLDNFSAWVIYISLLALSLAPALWGQTKAGDENLLFRKQDFENPLQSPTLLLLSTHSDSRLRGLADLFRTIAQAAPPNVPSLVAPPQTASTPTPTSSPAPTASGGAAWIQDHISPKTHSGNSSQPSSTTPAPSGTQGAPKAPVGTSNASWVLDFVSPPVAPKAFENSLLPARAVVFTGPVLSLLVGVGGWHVHHLAATLSALPLIGIYGVLRSLHRKDPLTSEYFEHLSRYKAHEVEQSDATIALRVATSRRDAVRANEAKNLAPIHQKRNSLKADLAVRLATIDGELKRHTTKLDSQRQQVDQALQALRAKSSATVQSLFLRLNDLDRVKASELAQELQTTQKQYVENALKTSRIAGAGVPGIGPQMTANLRAWGYVTAADINYNVTQVSGIGDNKAATLMAWRTVVLQRAEASKPHSLPNLRLIAVEDNYRELKKKIQQEIDSANAIFKAEESQIQSANANTLRNIEAERQLAQNQAQQRRREANEEHVRNMHQVAEEEQRIKVAASEEYLKIDKEIDPLKQRLAALDWKAVLLRRELEAHKDTTFGAYVKRAVRLW